MKYAFLSFENVFNEVQKNLRVVWNFTQASKLNPEWCSFFKYYNEVIKLV